MFHFGYTVHSKSLNSRLDCPKNMNCYTDDGSLVARSETSKPAGDTIHDTPAAAIQPSVDTPPIRLVVEPEDIGQIEQAVASWSIALGRKIKRPVFYLGSSSNCGYDSLALACADIPEYIVYIARREAMDRAQFYSTILHEIGHLLGVPHIVGDPLMNPVLVGNTIWPSADAIAIAKAHLGDK